MIVRTLFFGVVASCFAASAVQAEMIEIQITGLDFVFSGGKIYDAKSSATTGDPLDTNVADPLATLDFFKNGVLVGSLNANIYADLLVENVPNLPITGNPVPSLTPADSSFGLALLQGGDTPTRLLGLTFGSLNVSYQHITNTINIAVVGGGAELAAQSLPYGLVLDDDDTLGIAIASVSLSNPTYATDPEGARYATGFNASGVGSVNGRSGDGTIPEPATLTLLAVGALAGLGMLRLRKRVR